MTHEEILKVCRAFLKGAWTDGYGLNTVSLLCDEFEKLLQERKRLLDRIKKLEDGLK